MLFINGTSCDTKIKLFSYSCKYLVSHTICSSSKWLVGSSNINIVGLSKSNFVKSTFVLCPPLKSSTSLSNPISPRPRPFATSCIFASIV